MANLDALLPRDPQEDAKAAQDATALALVLGAADPRPRASQGLLDRIGEMARGAHERISPFNVMGAKDIASMLPGGGIPMAWEESGKARDALKAGEYGQALGHYGQMGLNLLPEGSALAALVAPASKAIKAYHGSPHDFDRFSLDKIGTGEGAQAYGHGLYFAESEGVAKSYRDKLAGMNQAIIPMDAQGDISKIRAAASSHYKDPADVNAAALLGNYLDGRVGLDVALEKALPHVDMFRTTEDAVRKVAGDLHNPGRMYEVAINADPAHFLDWDKPVPMGHPVRERIADLGMQGAGALNAADRNMAKDAFLAARNENMTGSGLYNSLTRSLEANRDNLKPQFGEEALFAKPTELARRDLLERGIPGIKYLDNGSRAAGDGSRNYVVFDDSLIDILRKYGLAPAAVGAGAASMIDGSSPTPPKPTLPGPAPRA